MSQEPVELGLTRVGLTLLRDLIAERTGVFYADDRQEMLAERLGSMTLDRGFHSYLDLFYLLKYEDNPEDWARVMDHLSVPETYFWREVDQIRAVVDRIIPELASKAGPRPLRIWSIPCASGEEPLTIAMLLEEAGWFDRVPIEVHASDASPAAIARASEGLYRGRAFRVLPPEMKEKYFEPCGNGWRPVSSLRARIASLSVVNLLSVCHVPLIASPVIFCRNAFIYFSPDGIRRATQAFASGMPTPGYLCIGASESLLNVTSSFTLLEIGGAFVYAKR